jgi:CTD small phosphatase-like protein 2
LRALVTIPYLPPLEEMDPAVRPKRAKTIDDIYTLVLDLDETLIHFEIDEDIDPSEEEPGYYLIRPGALKFLVELSDYYEIVVFTAAMPDVSSPPLNNS